MASNPLTEDDRKTIDTSLQSLKDAKEQIARAKLAGIDVSAEEAEVDKMTDQLQKIRQAYFPRRS